MIRIAEKDKDYVYVFADDFSEIEDLSSKTKTVLKTTYQDLPALVVKKEKKHIK